MLYNRSVKQKPGEQRAAPEPVLDRGRTTRRRIMEVAARLCVERPGRELSVAEIARAAGVFPNQITYYFGSKDSLLVHAAFLALLHDTRRIERMGAGAPDAEAFRRRIARGVLSLPSLPPVARALAAGISRAELAPVVDTHVHLLFRQSERYLRRLVESRGWRLSRPLELEVKTFWSAALGAALLSRAGVQGTGADVDLAGTLTVRDGVEGDR